MKRNIILDLLRVLACLMVVFYHYFYYGPLVGQVAGKLMDSNIFAYGYLGVDIFFVISGFVISSSLKKNNIYSFFKARFKRLYPTYWICLCISLVIISIFTKEVFTINEILINFTMLQSFFNVKSIDGVYWTLAIEIIFYLMISLMYFLFNKKLFNFYLMAWLALSYFHVFSLINFGLLSKILLLNWIPYFIFGFAFSCLIDKSNNYKYIIYILLSVFSLFLLCYRTYLRTENLINNNGFCVNSYAAVLVLLSFLCIFVVFVNVTIRSVLFNKVITSLALGTYPLYLLHQEVGYSIFSFAPIFNNVLGKVSVILSLGLISCYVIPKLEYLIIKIFNLVINNEKNYIYKQP
ncbi:acyltransferase [Vibrio cholerae]|uniref:acyltransferase family protein n=2 Tax=Vibrio cholerae TaxID=666 RepID=UPI0018F0E79A|nr:acyltransferase [Vibrio cholerae]MBJ6865933.1 acyltransferase [Vibrio cholerae]MBJ6869528.1 acyltransferase [Vibrio cholerae]MBJ6873252.1 acyltransferase [Vibrio cholerae]MBJ6876956.1 acyltransferase [Vibrio cholerae]